MSINSCSINEYTINTLCGRRRQVIIDHLRPVVPVVSGGHHPQHVNPATQVPLTIFRRDADRDEPFDYSTLEQSHMSVTIEMQGQSYSQTLERPNFDPVVTVYNMSASDKAEETINITDFNIKVL